MTQIQFKARLSQYYSVNPISSDANSLIEIISSRLEKSASEEICWKQTCMKSHVHVSTFSSLKFGRRLYCVRLRPVLSLFLSVSSIDIHKNFKHAESLFYGRVQKYNMQLQRNCLHSINRLLDSQIEEHLDDHVNIPITYTAQSP